MTTKGFTTQRPLPWSRRLQRLCFSMFLTFMMLGSFHLWFSRMAWQELAPFQEDRRLIEDQIQNPLSMVQKLQQSGMDHQQESSKADPSIDTFDYDVFKRRHSYVTRCADGMNTTLGKDVRSFITFDNDVKMAYCFVAKVGCTFWLRIFTFLTRRDEMLNLHIDTPFDIDRIKLHTGKLMTKVNRKFPDFQTIAKPDTIKFLFARNPYERLWSVYLDKYYLPDYWLFDPLGTSPCGVNTTFTQFLNNAVTSHDHHVIPVSVACNPCVFQPDVIGKMETFSRDSKHILDQAGHGHLLSNYNHSHYIEVELNSLLVYNFKLLERFKRMGQCLTEKLLCERLWHVFQINGHIPESAPFPAADDLGDYSFIYAKKAFLETVRNNPMTKWESRMQRKRFLAQAYSKVSPSTILGIQERYRSDFELFDYDMSPPRMD